MNHRHPGTSTPQKYAQAAARFRAFCDRQSLDLDAMPPGVLRVYSEALLHEGTKLSSVRSMISGVSKYLEWERARGRTLPTFATADLPQGITKPPNALAPDALLAYLRIAHRLPEPVRSTLMLLPYCGLRNAEMSHLKLRDIQIIKVAPSLTRPAINMVAFAVTGKGGVHRTAPLIADGKPILQHFLGKWRLYKHQSSPFLFPMRSGKPISSRTIRAYVKVIREKLGASELHPHMLRRTYGTALLRQGLDSTLLAKIMGHKSVQTTYQHYLEIQKYDVAAGVAGMSLVDVGSRAEMVSQAGARFSDFAAQTRDARLPVPDMAPRPPDDDEIDNEEDEELQ